MATVLNSYILSASEFTDEENPYITHNANRVGSGTTRLQVCISLGGEKDDVPYRDIPLDGNRVYTFNLTEAERNTLRAAVPKEETSMLVRFILKITDGTGTYTSGVSRKFTLVNYAPALSNLTVKNISSEVLALTGDENVLVKGVSMVEYGYTVAAKKYGTLVSHSITNGTKTITDLPQGVIDDVESGTFVFKAIDSRGATTTKTLAKSFIDYVKPTCYQKVNSTLISETSAEFKLIITGNYFNGTFGAVKNTLKLEVRHTQNDGTMGDWVDLSPLAYETDGNTYRLETTISGMRYDQTYDFQCRATDKLYSVVSTSHSSSALPVFDWSKDDFNFNVPVNINGDTVSIHGETVLRHNEIANNTVLSASGGHIYVRPGGTDETDNEAIFYPDGSVNFSGPVKVNGVEIGAGVPSEIADYIVETGTEAMGSNGTWYWEKWNSGKAVCYGCRNYGVMSITSASNNQYISTGISQSFPSGLFNDVPLITTANLACYDDVDDTRKRVARGMITASRVYLYVRSETSTSLRVSYISIQAIGRWK